MGVAICEQANKHLLLLFCHLTELCRKNRGEKETISILYETVSENFTEQVRYVSQRCRGFGK